MSKFLLDHMATFVVAEYPNVTVASIHTGIVATDISVEPFVLHFNTDSPGLVSGTAVCLCQEKARFLSSELEYGLQERDGIREDDLLKLGLREQFGSTSF